MWMRLSSWSEDEVVELEDRATSIVPTAKAVGTSKTGPEAVVEKLRDLPLPGALEDAEEAEAAKAAEAAEEAVAAEARLYENQRWVVVVSVQRLD